MSKGVAPPGRRPWPRRPAPPTPARRARPAPAASSAGSVPKTVVTRPPHPYTSSIERRFTMENAEVAEARREGPDSRVLRRERRAARLGHRRKVIPSPYSPAQPSYSPPENKSTRLSEGGKRSLAARGAAPCRSRDRPRRHAWARWGLSFSENTEDRKS